MKSVDCRLIDKGLKGLIDTFVHALAVAAQKEHGLNTELGLVKTRTDEREIKDIMLGKKQNIVQSIHVGKETFGAGILGDNVMEQYEISLRFPVKFQPTLRII